MLGMLAGAAAGGGGGGGIAAQGNSSKTDNGNKSDVSTGDTISSGTITVGGLNMGVKQDGITPEQILIGAGFFGVVLIAAVSMRSKKK